MSLRQSQTIYNPPLAQSDCYDLMCYAICEAYVDLFYLTSSF